MRTPFVDLAFVQSEAAPALLAVERSDSDVRDNAAHSHSSGQLLGSSRGLLSIATDSGNWVVPATNAMWIPPHHRHALRSHGPFSGWVMYIKEEACGALPRSPRTLQMSGLLREAIHRASTWGLASRTPAQNYLVEVILEEVATLPEAPLGLVMPGDPRLIRMATAMISDPADKRGLEEWARWAHVSPRTASRRFVAETGFTFTAWRQRARLLRSLELLSEGLPVTTIALELGYANVSAFIAMFKRTFGSAPKQFGLRS